MILVSHTCKEIIVQHLVSKHRNEREVKFEESGLEPGEMELYPGNLPKGVETVMDILFV